LSLPWKELYKEFYVPTSALQTWANARRSAGETIVTTNGSFDLLHAGHLHTLFEAKSLGSCFIVLLNSDASVRGYKGPLRPIIPLTYRLQMVAALKCVDFVSSFDELDPRAALERIRPDIHVNSAEYGDNPIEKSIVEANGGRLHIIEKIEGLSTTQVLKNVEKCTASQL